MSYYSLYKIKFWSFHAVRSYKSSSPLLKRLPSASSLSSSSLPLPPSMCSWRQHTLRGRQRRRRSTWPDKCLSPSHMRFAAVTNAPLYWSLSWSARLWCLKTFKGEQNSFLLLLVGFSQFVGQRRKRKEKVFLLSSTAAPFLLSWSSISRPNLAAAAQTTLMYLS